MLQLISRDRIAGEAELINRDINKYLEMVAKNNNKKSLNYCDNQSKLLKSLKSYFQKYENEPIIEYERNSGILRTGWKLSERSPLFYREAKQNIDSGIIELNFNSNRNSGYKYLNPPLEYLLIDDSFYLGLGYKDEKSKGKIKLIHENIYVPKSKIERINLGF